VKLVMQKQKQNKLRQFHWSKIKQDQLSSTIWGVISANNANVNLEELESQFEIKDKSKAATKVATKKKSTTVHLIDLKRSHNISIELGGIRMPYAKIKQALLEMDGATLSVENLQVLSRAVPTSTEIQQVQGYKGDVELLGSVEKYFLEVLTIPRLGPRIDASIFKMNYRQTAAKLRKDLETLTGAARQLTSSKNFMKLLETVLSVGNHLNGGTYRGGAMGFNMRDLLKLGDVRGNNRNVSLLNFITGNMLKSQDSAQFLPAELDLVPAASILQMWHLDQVMTELNQGVKLTKEEIMHASIDAGAGAAGQDKFRDVALDFVEECEPDVEALRELYRATKASLEGLLNFFGEDSKGNPQDFLQIIKRFMEQFSRSLDDVRKQAEQKRKLEKASQMRQMRRSQSVSSIPRVGDLQGAEGKDHGGLKAIAESPEAFSPEKKGEGPKLEGQKAGGGKPPPGPGGSGVPKLNLRGIGGGPPAPPPPPFSAADAKDASMMSEDSDTSLIEEAFGGL